MSGYTKIGEIPAKICSEVCTLYVKGHGCQASRTARLRDDPIDKCPVGKEQAEAWYERNMRQKQK